jgi:hypothetical protein
MPEDPKARGLALREAPMFGFCQGIDAAGPVKPFPPHFHPHALGGSAPRQRHHRRPINLQPPGDLAPRQRHLHRQCHRERLGGLDACMRALLQDLDLAWCLCRHRRHASGSCGKGPRRKERAHLSRSRDGLLVGGDLLQSGRPLASGRRAVLSYVSSIAKFPRSVEYRSSKQCLQVTPIRGSSLFIHPSPSPAASTRRGHFPGSSPARFGGPTTPPVGPPACSSAAGRRDGRSA